MVEGREPGGGNERCCLPTARRIAAKYVSGAGGGALSALERRPDHGQPLVEGDRIAELVARRGVVVRHELVTLGPAVPGPLVEVGRAGIGAAVVVTDRAHHEQAVG